ncbi:hypothetical protein [Glycomyces buryatensis]|uniref:RADC family protein n=1 Tax=Glycomyces buryatensis TaxID=2570927 RepID=A0A4V6T6N6_9ACTN|nr:hypothetical protein [Glycomyces buryatensis]THV39506.1 hypothetical protein FAB82_18030 [Glycomyces buryatensis]
MLFPYTGSGSYCYANSLSMVLGPDSPGPAVIEVLTGSPWGMQILGGTTPFFDPAGFDGDIALDAALGALGWKCRRVAGDRDEAERLLRTAKTHDPVLVGPVEVGLHVHRPGLGEPIGGDHFVVALGVANDMVRFHDPAGFPFATLPIGQFLDAWRTDSLDYGESYTARTAFAKAEEIDAATAIESTIPAAIAWLTGEHDHPVPAGTLRNREAAEHLASLIEDGLPEQTRNHLVHFAIQVGARRLADAALCLSGIGRNSAAKLAAHQSELVGGLQYEVVTGRTDEAAAALRALGPTYDELAERLLNGRGTE